MIRILIIGAMVLLVAVLVISRLQRRSPRDAELKVPRGPRRLRKDEERDQGEA